jgi:hypothetical protein
VLWVNSTTKPIDIAGEPPQPPPQFGPGNGGNGKPNQDQGNQDGNADNLAGKVLEAIKRKLA